MFRCHFSAACCLPAGRAITSEARERLEGIQASVLQELQRQLLENHPEDALLTSKLTEVLSELRRMAYKLDIILARLLKEFKHLPIPASLREYVSPEGMAYSVPEKPLPGINRDTLKRPALSPKPRNIVPIPYPPQTSPEEPASKRVSWEFVPPSPSSISIPPVPGQPLLPHIYSSLGDGTLHNGALGSGSTTPFMVQNILEKPEPNHEPVAPPEARFIFPDQGSEFGHVHSFAHIFTQRPLKFSRELESEPVITEKVETVPDDATERVITYENL